jgi:mRNA-degrading endonuclease RelE of RelBE toxin-antitoxin system
MVHQIPYSIIYAANIKRHLRFIEPQYHTLIQTNVVAQLQYEPTIQTKNRKPLKQSILNADWEIRFGPNNRFRVLYRVDRNQRIVYILAIGEKVHNRLKIGNEEILP